MMGPGEDTSGWGPSSGRTAKRAGYSIVTVSLSITGGSNASCVPSPSTTQMT
jgi:hypothetical protein